jgi:hypothetical protein
MTKKNQTEVCTATFSSMWLAGTPTRIIAETLKISADRCDVTRKTLGLPPRESWHGSKTGHRKAYLPTEEEIREKCLAFQATWSDEERERRRVGQSNPQYEVPIISESSFRVTSSGDDSPSIEDLADTSGG